MAIRSSAACSTAIARRPRSVSSTSELERCVRTEQWYIENTAIVVTRLYDDAGAIVEITDFAPRFQHYNRSFHPTAIVRQVKPVRGLPRIELRLRPAYEYGAASARGHARVESRALRDADLTMRLTTDAPISYLVERGAVPARGSAHALSRARRDARSLGGRRRPRVLRAHAGVLARLDPPSRHPVRVAGARSSAPRSRSSCRASRRPAPSSPR